MIVYEAASLLHVGLLYREQIPVPLQPVLGVIILNISINGIVNAYSFQEMLHFIVRVEYNLGIDVGDIWLVVLATVLDGHFDLLSVLFLLPLGFLLITFLELNGSFNVLHNTLLGLRKRMKYYIKFGVQIQ